MSYNPDEDVVPDQTWTTVWLSNRDLSGQVPINFVTHAAVSVTPACFANGTYDLALAERCISNLLASHFRRITLDLYWDSNYRQFSLCPVALPPGLNNATSGTTRVPLAQTFKRAAAATTAQSSFFSSGAEPSLTVSTSNSSLPIGNFSSTPMPTTTSAAPITTATDSSGNLVLGIGPYQCTPSLTLRFVTSLIFDYLVRTSDTIQANLLILELNLHAAASYKDPQNLPETPDGNALPAPTELVGTQFVNAMSDYVFSPNQLQRDRANLNDSWYHSPLSRYPIAEYFTTSSLTDGSLTTPDGWPNEDYLQITKGMRLLLTWGTIDPQMHDYNFAGDADSIFPQAEVSRSHPIAANDAGGLVSGCYFKSTETRVENVNSSWALTVQDQNSPALLSLAGNITSCGISPVLNWTLSNTGANGGFAQYESFARAAVWNWALGEPKNSSSSDKQKGTDQLQFRCALLDMTTAYQGHWRVEYCQRNYRAACRVDNNPYVWQLSATAVPYGSGPEACPANTTFSMPRTGLENTYLFHQALSESQSLSKSGKTPISGVWVDFNSIDVETCWVTTGPNGTCPYYADAAAEKQRSILVPTIAAMIVLVITALTLFVKCNANRRNSKARRRGEGGWDYEGVPS